MSVVPVSMAARFPDGKVTFCPLTVIPAIVIRVRKSRGDEGDLGAYPRRRGASRFAGQRQ